jgi:hypothetical protein
MSMTLGQAGVLEEEEGRAIRHGAYLHDSKANRSGVGQDAAGGRPFYQRKRK